MFHVFSFQVFFKGELRRPVFDLRTWIKKLQHKESAEQANKYAKHVFPPPHILQFPQDTIKFYWNEVNPVLGPYRDSLGLLRGTL